MSDAADFEIAASPLRRSASDVKMISVKCLIQKIYESGGAQRNIKKLFAYGTLHGGIHFDIAGGQLVENLRDIVG